MNPLLKINHLNFSYADKVVIRDFSLELGQTEIVCIMGPSGCGKTTLLRVLAGLETHGPSHAGPSLVWAGGKRPRRTGLVFQEPRLLPWRTIEQNLVLALSSLSPGPRHQARLRIPELLESFGIADSRAKLPDQLSGGMRQRVALVRALLFGQELQLWDEPFQSLDAQRRQACWTLVRDWWRQQGSSALVVTHDPVEAAALGDRVIKLS